MISIKTFTLKIEKRRLKGVKCSSDFSSVSRNTYRKKLK